VTAAPSIPGALGRATDRVATYRRLTWLALGLLLTGVLVGIVVPAGPGWDFANFYDTGRRVAAGQIADLYNPGSLIAGERPQGALRFWGTPISALLYVPLAHFPPRTALVLFKVQSTVAYFAALLLLFLHTRGFDEQTPVAQWKYTALFTWLALIYQPLWTIYRVGGQTTPTVLLLFIVALLCHTRGRFACSAACLTLAVLIKPAFAPALALLTLVSGWSFFAAATGAVVIAATLSLAVMGWAPHAEFVRLVMAEHSLPRDWVTNSSLFVTLDNLRNYARTGGGLQWIPGVARVVIPAVKLIVLAAAGVLLASSRQWVAPARRHFAFLVALAFALLTSDTVWEHYLAFLFPLLCYIVASRRQFGREALALVAAIFVPAGAAPEGSGPLAWVLGLLAWAAKMGVLCLALAVFESAIAKMRVFRYADFLGAALMLGLLATLLLFVSQVT
jgi:hypothetical protein